MSARWDSIGAFMQMILVLFVVLTVVAIVLDEERRCE